MQEPIASIVLADWSDPKVEHAINAALMKMNGEWDATSPDSRSRLLTFVREGGFPNAALVYDPAEGAVPRVHILPEGRS